jgi:hypothetical protein
MDEKDREELEQLRRLEQEDQDDQEELQRLRRADRSRRRRNGPGRRGGLDGYGESLSEALDALVDNRDGGQVTDAMTQALLAVIGSGPSIAVLDSMISANQANGLMYHNSVAHQQKTNIFGMVATMQCVARLLDGPGAAGINLEADIEP